MSSNDLPAVYEGPQVPEGEKRHLGGGIHVWTRSQGSETEAEPFRVESPFPVPGWQARKPEELGRAPFPGTALEFEERWYEIIGQGREGSWFRYDLSPWSDNQTLRRADGLTPEGCRAHAAEVRRRKQRERRSRDLTFAGAFAGLLPTAEQERLELEYGVSAVRNTLFTAVPFLSVSIFLIMVAVSRVLGTDFGRWNAAADTVVLLLPLWAYLAVESLIRLASTFTGRPMGTIFVALPLRMFGVGNPKTIERRQDAHANAALAGSEASWREAKDRVRPLPPGEDGLRRLEIRSRLPKDHWLANVEAIVWDGVAYELVERSEEATSAGTVHVFELHEPEGQRLYRRVHHFRPEEVVDVYREQRRLSAAAWIETFHMLWGFTDEGLQDDLAEVYAYEPTRSTRASIWLATIFGVLALGHPLWRAAGGISGTLDILLMILGAVALWEAAMRAVRLSRGEIATGLLGPLFTPFARPALRWRPRPESPYAGP
ncbi:MAG: hypothetical protein AAGD06_33395 [Acidobacteriota bacterium]